VGGIESLRDLGDRHLDPLALADLEDELLADRARLGDADRQLRAGGQLLLEARRELDVPATGLRERPRGALLAPLQVTVTFAPPGTPVTTRRRKVV
jgi:hypothetical protein